MKAERLKPGTIHGACESGCRSATGGVSSATYRVTIIGYDVFVCGKCAKAWPDIWQKYLTSCFAPRDA